MRILAASTGGAGHIGPMLPFLRGAAAAGADVLVAAPESVRTEDLPFRALPDTPPEILGAVFGSLPDLPREEANDRVLGEVFGTANVDATLAAHEALLAEWRPDVVVRETAELASYVAATRAGVPTITVAIGLARLDARLHDVLDERGFESRYGAPVAPLRTARTVSLVPPTLDAGARREHYRDPAPPPDGALPDDLPDDDRPLVYVTFGSVTAAIPHFAGIYRAALDALAGLPARVLLTLGHAGDPDALGPVPPNARVARWVPQAAVLRSARVAVGHGGFGTTFGALAAGVPLVVLPLFAGDQFENAAAVAAFGAGVAVDDPAALGEAVSRVLADGTYRAGAGRLAAEMAALPSAADWSPRP